MKEQEQARPFWSSEELHAVVDRDIVHEIYEINHPKLPRIDWNTLEVKDQEEEEEKPQQAQDDVVYFKHEVLKKYTNHPYCDVGTDDAYQHGYLRFLSLDKRPDSALPFVNMSKQMRSAL